MPPSQAAPDVVLLSRHHLPAAIEVLARAFQPDPLMRYIFAEADAPFEECLRELFRFSCEVRFLLNWPLFGSFSGTRLLGVAGVTEPEDTPWPPPLVSVYEHLKAVIGPGSTEHMERYAHHVDQFRPQEPHYHLGMIGVDPAAQGRGHGRGLLEAVQALSEQHPASTGVWLDTENPRNVTIYGRCGYGVIAQTQYGGVDIWCMFRPNQSRHAVPVAV